MFIKEHAEKAIKFAKHWSFINKSAELAVEDAIWLFEKGEYKNSTKRALTSLCHSVGIFHPDYKEISEGR